MPTPSAVELLLLPEREAAERFLDGKIEAGLRWLAAGFVAAAAIAGMVAAGRGDSLLLVLQLAGVLLGAAVLLLSARPFFAAHLRPLVAAYLLIQFALFSLAANLALAVTLAAVIFPAALLLLPLPPAHLALLCALFVGGGLWRALTAPEASGPEATRAGLIVGVVVPAVALAAGAAARRRGERRRFVERWRQEAPRERERRRMRDELADARKIQLGMLPQDAPDLPWLDLATLSLPATEVGGDYFDFFPLDGCGLAVVIGDVAGHGVGSGLVLSGVKSGLYLLRDRLGSPVEVIDKLNGMVRDSMRWRMFVTMLVAVLDPVSGRLRAVSAGHPPLLHVSAADGTVRELADGAPPLGTRLVHEFREVEVALAPGDVVLLYSDGLSEVRGATGETFGDGRLGRELARAAKLSTAAAMRDSLLHGLSRFKGDTVQNDDLTLVVARMREARG